MNALLQLALPLFALSAFTPSAEQISIESRSGLSYETRVERSKSLTLVGASMLVGGEEFPAGMLEGAVPDQEETELVVYRDVVREANDGQPVYLVREFLEITQEKTVSEELSKESGALEGVTLVLELDEDGESEARLEDDSEAKIDEAYLTGHFLLHPVALILPEGEVTAGDSWTPSAEAVQGFLLPAGPEYFDPNGTKSLTDLLKEDVECSAEVTFESRVDLDGTECFLLSMKARLAGSIDELPEQFQSGSSESKEGSIEVGGEFDVEFWIAVETGVPIRLEVKSDMTFVVEMIMDHQGMTVESNLELLVTGSTLTEWEILESGK